MGLVRWGLLVKMDTNAFWWRSAWTDMLGCAKPSSSAPLKGSGSASQLGWGRGGRDALLLPCWNAAGHCGQSSPSVIAGSPGATQLQWPLSVSALCRLISVILLNISFPVNLMWQKRVYFYSVPVLSWLSSFGAKWEISFSFKDTMAALSEESNSMGRKGAGSQ